MISNNPETIITIRTANDTHSSNHRGIDRDQSPRSTHAVR
jgi:hypothetical protein